MNPLVDNSSTNDVYLEIQYPQAEIVFGKENIQPSEELKNAINSALDNQDPHHKLMKVFDKYGHFFAQKITLGQRLYRKSQFKLNEMPDLRNFHEILMAYLISNDGDLVQRDDLEKWITSCFEYPHESLKIIKKSNLIPLYEIFNDTTIQNIQSVLGISSGQLTTYEINERVLMTGVLQIRKPITYYRINFDTHLKSHDYKVFGNIVNEKHQLIEGLVINFDSENKSGFSIIIESSEDAINVDWSKLQINWVLVGKPAEIAKIQTYNNKDLKLNIINYNPLDFDEDDEPDDDSADSDESDDSADKDENNVIDEPDDDSADSDDSDESADNGDNADNVENNVIDTDNNNSRSNDSRDLHWFIISVSESHESIKADIVSESHEDKFINLSSIGLKIHINE
ncbi:chitin synthase regulatory factor chr2 [Gigaspora margarita]|uniref:Chitin synthase regulatory factor chr2 n=1 Tax=Gigaspora margarita TaxID=4874 RepID=A0A8H3XJ82_GIGMA|nr:chitin synthase regulatory factor chr2 [Gigaspora margarita]